MSAGRRDLKYLLVVSVLKGRYLLEPSSADKGESGGVYVQVTFANKCLQTTTAPPREANPTWNADFRWELSEKQLLILRQNRASVKIQLCLGGVPLGHIMVMLRDIPVISNGQPPSRPAWEPLLNARKSGGPELLLCANLRNKELGSENPPLRCPPMMKVRVDIGDGKDQFVMKLVIVSCRNLVHLMSGSNTTPKPPDGFHFFFTLFDNPITTKVIFTDATNPDFRPWVASFIILSSVKELQEYFSLQKPLNLFLCKGDKPLGCASLSLSTLTASLASNTPGPGPPNYKIEQSYILRPSQDQESFLPPAEQPSVFVHLSLARLVRKKIAHPVAAPSISPHGGPPVTTNPRESRRMEMANDEMGSPQFGGTPGAIKEDRSSDTDGEIELTTRETTRKTSSDPTESMSEVCEQDRASPIEKKPETEPQKSSTFSGVDSMAKERSSEETMETTRPIPNKNVSFNIRDTNSDTKQIESDGDAEALTNCHDGIEQGTRSLSTSSVASNATRSARHQSPHEPNVISQMDIRHFRFSLELKSVRGLEVFSGKQLVLRYNYTAFDSSSASVFSEPFMVSSSHALSKSGRVGLGQSVAVPGGFTSFTFTKSWPQLSLTLKDEPLIVEILSEQPPSGSGNFAQVAMCIIGLDTVLRCPPISKPGHNPSSVASVHANSDWFPICISTDKSMSKRIGDLMLAMTLEDLGGDSSDTAYISSGISQAIGDKNDTVVYRDSQEYAAALELEIWKHDQQQKYVKDLHEVEAKLLAALEQQFIFHEQQRIAKFRTYEQQYNSLNEKLTSGVEIIHQREHQLAAAEEKLRHKQEALQHELDLKTQELQLVAKRLTEDFSRKELTLSQKIQDLITEKSHLQASISSHESRYLDLEKKFQIYKEAHATSPSASMQAQLAILNSQKSELERKLQQVSEESSNRKQKLMRAFQEIARLKGTTNHTEFSTMNYNTLPQQTPPTITQQLPTVTQGTLSSSVPLAFPKATTTTTPSSAIPSAATLTTTGNLTNGIPGGISIASMTPQQQEIALQLLQERSTLLQTGYYTATSPLIVQIDHTLADMAKASSNVND
ncbi:centrosomal protein of 120 kDa [Pelomyxa schiedti]|nr:centrosomal protein of 120 kDa [Pelomyxa schiedti]